MTRLMVQWLMVALFLLQGHSPAFADDTCVFSVNATAVPPNVVFLLDNGAEMEQIIWHSAYDNSVIYGGGATLTNSGGYAVVKSGNSYFLRPILADLTIASSGGIQADADQIPTWTINGRKVTLPTSPSTSVDGVGIKDNATVFRYSLNYLNWIFYSPDWITAGNPGLDNNGDGIADNNNALPTKSRFYYAKQAIFAVARQTANRAQFGIYNFNATSSGASNVQPLKMVVITPLVTPSSNNVLDPNFVNNVNNMGTVTYSPLAEGLASIGGYFNSPSAGVVDLYCQKNFVLVVTPGVSSKDRDGASTYRPSSFSDYDGDGLDTARTLTIDNVTPPYTIPINQDGTTWLDDVAYYMATHDMIDRHLGVQTVNTYTVGFMGSEASRRFLINTSNNGNKKKNLYDSTDPEYGKYHFDAASPEGLAQSLIDALNTILEKTNAFAAPVVPITRTTSGDRLYMSFFTPNSKSNFWQGNVVKFGLNTNLEIVDKNGDLATYSNGALKETAEPYWATVDWADTSKDNGVLNTARNIYTYLGTTALSDASNAFKDDNPGLTQAVLGNPTAQTATEIINYVRGADVFAADPTKIAKNRALITGDVLHSEPLVYQYIQSSGVLTIVPLSGTFQAGEYIRGSKGGYATTTSGGGTSLSYSELKAPFTPGETLTGLTSGATATIGAVPDVIMIYYGANDGMLHAVRDTDGKEAWGFIPPNQLARLKLMMPQNIPHQYYVDASPKIYLYDVNGNGFLDLADGDKVILVSGERKGSTGYFALDVTDPETPVFLWRINQLNDLTFAPLNTVPPVTEVSPKPYGWVVPQLGESWSEPRFGKVKTSATDIVGTPVFVIGGGYSNRDNSSLAAYNNADLTGSAVLVINVLTGQPVKIFENDTDGNANMGTNINGMKYSIPSTVRAMDTDRNGFIDKIYVGDMGGQLWRIGRFDKDESGIAIAFPKANENIHDWQGQMIFSAGCSELSCTDTIDNINVNGLFDEWRRFFYPPTVTLEKGYDLVLIGSGDRENSCARFTQDEMYAIRDDHSLLPTTAPQPPAWTRSDLTNITTIGTLDPTKQGLWYLQLASGEKVLAEGTVYSGILYFTTFTPNDDRCVPGGAATLYGLQYKTGAPGADFIPGGTLERSIIIGGGIPSRPVIVISDTASAMFVSVGSANPDAASPSSSAAIFKPKIDLSKKSGLIWWREGD